MSSSGSDAPVGLPGLMITMARTSTPSAVALAWAAFMVARSVPQLLASSSRYGTHTASRMDSDAVYSGYCGMGTSTPVLESAQMTCSSVLTPADAPAER